MRPFRCIKLGESAYCHMLNKFQSVIRLYGQINESRMFLLKPAVQKELLSHPFLYVDVAVFARVLSGLNYQ